MIVLDREEAGRALGLEPLPGPVRRVCTDSRHVQPGDLFVALKGERFDGHEFVAEALAAGAMGALVEAHRWVYKGTAGLVLPPSPSAGQTPEGQPFVYDVGDTLKALGALAREVRRKSAAVVVAVTGSVGKTSTKDLIGAMAGRARRVVVTAANQNNEVGVPVTLLAIEPDTELVVVEMGMRGPGQIAALARVAEPDVGVVTNVYPVHLELLGTLENIAEAKAELLASLGPTGVAVIPTDCDLLRSYAAAASCRVVGFGFGPGTAAADVHGCLCSRTEEGAGVLRVRWPDGEAEVEVPFGSRHRLENTVAASAACYAAGLPMERCIPGVADARFSGSRGDVMLLPGLTLIDDSYNASPAAVRAALDDLVDLAVTAGGRPVAVLGDMLELGPDAEAYHAEAGAYAAEAGVAALWGVGPLSRSTVEGFRQAWASSAGKEPGRVIQAGNLRSADEASPVLASLRPGDVVLVKASRRVGLEVLVRRIAEAAGTGAWAYRPEPDADRPGATEGSEA